MAHEPSRKIEWAVDSMDTNNAGVLEPTIEQLREQEIYFNDDEYVDELLREHAWVEDDPRYDSNFWRFHARDADEGEYEDENIFPEEAITFGWDRSPKRKRQSKRWLYWDQKTYQRRVKQLARSWNCDKNIAEGLLASAVYNDILFPKYLQAERQQGKHIPNKGRPPRLAFPRPSKQVPHLQEK